MLAIFSTAAGVVISLPMGPIGALILTNSVKKGFVGGTTTLSALILGEIPYIAAFCFGISGYLIDNPNLKHPLMIFGGGFMLFLGWSHITRVHSAKVDSATVLPDQDKPEIIPSEEPLARIFLDSFLVTISNPGILVVFASVVGSAYAFLGESYVRDHVLELLIFLEVGTILFFVPVCYFASRLGKGFSVDAHRKIDIFAGAFLAIFGIWIIGSDLLQYFRGM